MHRFNTWKLKWQSIREDIKILLQDYINAFSVQAAQAALYVNQMLNPDSTPESLDIQYNFHYAGFLGFYCI